MHLRTARRRDWAGRRHRDQRGITGIETAIILIAMVIVGTVFSVTLLNTGLLSAKKSEETVIEGLKDTASTLFLRGSVFAQANPGKTAIDTIKFYLIVEAQSVESVDLSSTGTVVTYQDSDNALNCTAGGAGSCSWAASWVVGSGELVDPGEKVELTVTFNSMTPALGRSKEFTIQVRPSRGAAVVVNRSIPAEVKAVMDLY